MLIFRLLARDGHCWSGVGEMEEAGQAGIGAMEEEGSEANSGFCNFSHALGTWTKLKEREIKFGREKKLDAENKLSMF